MGLLPGYSKKTINNTELMTLLPATGIASPAQVLVLPASLLLGALPPQIPEKRTIQFSSVPLGGANGGGGASGRMSLSW
jgi:hypothetical protein